MKKILYFALIISLSVSVFAQNLQISENSYEKVSIMFESDSLLVEEVSVNGSTFSRISMQNYDISNNPGAPQLPVLSKLLQIPVCDSVIATVVRTKYMDYDASALGINRPLFPAQPSVSRSETTPPFAYNQLIYNTNEFYALPLVSVEKTGIRRSVSLANVYVSPVQYNPVTQTIRIYTRIEVEFSFVNPNMEMTTRLEEQASPLFDLDNSLVVNRMSDDSKAEFSSAPIKYLIIANAMFASNTDLAAFADWKRRLGYLVEVAYTNDASVGTTTTSIKSFIQSRYNSATSTNPAPTFLLLIGDVAQLPAFTGETNTGHVTDLYYATLAGNDNIPDCYYGRLSATNNTQLSNQIAKILMYEQYAMPDPSYLGNAVLIAGTDGNGYSPTHADGQINYIYNYYINTNSTTHHFTNVYKHNYNCSSDAATIRSEINAGVSIANYTAHGSSSGWADPAFTTSHVSSMTNAGKYGLLIGNCCLSGKFDDSECFGESLLRAANKGAMGYIGASNSSYWYEDVYWAVGVRSSINANMSYNSSKLGVYDKLFHTHNEAYSNWVSTIGGILQGGNLSVQSSSSSRKKYYWEIYHCFGDPSVRVYLGIPNTLTVTCDANIPLSNSSCTVQTVPYAYVALKKGTTQFVSAVFANANGTATLTLPTSLDMGTYELVVLAQNYIPYFQTIEVVDDGACLSPSNMTVSDITPFSAVLSWTGSGDHYNIQWKTNSTNWTTLATNVTATSYSLTGLQDNTSYQVRVQAVCSEQTSHWKVVDFTTTVACPTPTDLYCSAFTTTTSTLNWTENGTANSWTLQFGTDSSFVAGTYTEVNVTNPSVFLSDLIAETAYYARVRANCGDIYGLSQWSSVCMFMPSAVQTREIGDGGTTNNTFLPSYNYYKYCISQQIYTPEEIGSAGVIKSISFKNTGEEKTRTYTVYLQHTDKEMFSSNSDWVPENSGNEVFNGEVTFTPNEWTKITFNHPFVYDGESNLLVTVADTTGSYTSSPHMSCLVFNAPSKAIYAYRDNPGAFDIAAPGVAGNVPNVKNQIRVDIVPAEGPSCPKPNQLAASDVTANSATLTWNENGTAGEWVLHYGTNSSFDTGTYTEMTVSGTPSLSLTELTAETDYYARVKAVCSAVDESQWSGTCMFTPTKKMIVGSGSATNVFLPTHNFYKYSLTQQIYTSADLGEAGDIVSVDFYKNNIVECKRFLDIYMVSTTKSTFSSDSDWIAVTAADKVFSDTVYFADNAWTTITLDTPFSYDGAHNIAIVVDDNTGSYKSSTPFLAFSAPSQAIRIFSDNVDYDASDPSSYSGKVENMKNQMRILKNVPVPCPEPTEFTATACESYSWGDLTYTVSGDYDQTFTIANNCDSVVTLHLTVHYGTHNTETDVACDSYEWHGVTYTESAIYTYEYMNAVNCPSVDTLHLTVNYSNTGDTAVEACGSYTWIDGNTYTESTDAPTYTLVNAAGCDSVVTLHLTIHTPEHTATTATACESFTWNGTEYTESGNYLFDHADAHGCTQVDTLHLTINHTTYGDTTVVACESFTWHGTTYAESGDYLSSTSYLTNSAGCDSIVTLHLTIHNPVHTVVSETACESFIWNGTEYTESGNYLFSHEDVHGCTQVDTLHLTIHNPVHTAVFETSCESFIWNGTEFTESGNYLSSHEDAHGCTQVDTLHLTIHNPVHTAVSETACETFTWNGTKYTESGNYLFSHEDAHGCTQVDTLHLTINNPVHTAVSETACESFMWNGTEYTESGNYLFSYKDVYGCTQVDTLHLTINNPVHTTVSETACESFTWNGTEYTESGNYLFSHEDAHGCTQVDTLHLMIHNPVHTAVSETACESFTWNGTEYTESGNYLFSHEDAHGCTQVDTLHLTIHNPEHTATTATACESFTWNGTEYTESGNYLFSYKDVYGCTQVDTLHLTINNPVHTTVSETACESFTWNGTEYTESGNYLFSHEDAHGCTQVDTLHLMIHNPVHTAVSETACESFTWNGTEYTESGNYLFSHEDAHGCTQVDTLHLTINHTTYGDTTVVACESFTWHGTTYTESGDYLSSTSYLTNSAGCDSIVTLHLTIHNPVHTAVSETACESFTWNGTEYTESGNYLFSHEDAHGCTQVDTLHLTIHTPDHTSVSEIAYDSYSWNGATYDTTGVYTYAHEDGNGCTQVDTLHLTVYYSSANDLYETACESFSWNGETLTSSGDYERLFHDIHGADSLVTMHLTVHYGTHNTETDVACDSYEWYGVTYTESDLYTYEYTNAVNCPSVDTLHLTVNYSSTGDTAVEACGSYTWIDGNTYTESTDAPTYTLVNAAGCDSVVTLHLTIHTPQHTAVTATACESFTWQGMSFFTSGDYTHSHVDAHGCTQVDTLHLIIHTPEHTSVSEIAYDSYIWNGATYDTTGVYTYAHEDGNGCTQVDTLHLTVYYSSTNDLYETACESFTWNGETLTSSGDYERLFHDIHGADSLVTLHLTVHYGTHNTETDVACDSYEWYGVTYTESDLYTYEYTNAVNCPSVDTLHLTVNYSSTGDTAVEACGSYTWIDGNTYTESTDAPTYTLVNAAGCDSVVTLHLTIHTPEHTATTVTACESFTWQGMSFFTSGDYTYSHADAHGCTQVDTLHLTIHNPEHTSVSEIAYDSYSWNGATYDTTGVYTYAHEDGNGCTQVDTLHLTVYYSSTNDLYETACESFSWNGETLTSSGDYERLFHDIHGADSLVTLHLTVHYGTHNTETDVACDSYEWHGVTYTESAIYTYEYMNAVNCPSVDTLHLTVNYSSTGDTAVEACGSYTWIDGSTYTESTDAPTYTLVNAAGCDSVVTLHLTIHTPEHTAVTATACESFTWNGTEYTESGNYLFDHADAHGCTQVDTLHLTINHTTYGDTTVVACESFTWHGTTYTESGDYPSSTSYLTNSAGCDSIVTLYLTINHIENSAFTIETSDSCYEWNGQFYCSSGDYEQTLTAITGCDSVVTLHLTTSVGVEDHEWETHVYLAPNPARQVTRIIGLREQPDFVEILDLSGRLVKRFKSTDLEVSTLATGAYLVKIHTSHGIINRKLIKQ